VRQFKPLPADMVLASTLARRVQQLRDFRNMTAKDLAKISRFGLQRIEDIESGMETWLSATERQLLAKALAVEPVILQEAESRPPADDGVMIVEQARIADAVLQGTRNLLCPNCGSSLRCSIQEALDIHGYPTVFPKAYCSKCPFVLK